jgi:hypothetical protein
MVREWVRPGPPWGGDRDGRLVGDYFFALTTFTDFAAEEAPYLPSPE